jgi:trans-2,3-dihydro-3-hydroxyanthranilate isomerase
MELTTVDMFGTAPGRGSALDVLVPTGRAEAGEADAAAAEKHAGRGAVDEVVLVSAFSAELGTFGTRVFNARGETPFATHSLAGAAAVLVRSGRLPAGEVTRTAGEAAQPMWTDGEQVRVPFRAPVVHEPVAGDVLAPYRGSASSCGPGRGFTLVRVDDDPLALPPPDAERMRAGGLTDLTLFHWEPRERRVTARVFAPGFAIPEDAGCLPVAAALGLATALLDPGAGRPVEVRQLTGRGTESAFTCTGTVRDGLADLLVAGRVRAHPTERK